MAIKDAHTIAMFIKETSLSAIKQLEDGYLLYQVLVAAKAAIDALQTQLKESHLKITALEQEIVRLKEQLQLAQQRQFGQRKETGEVAEKSKEPPLAVEQVAGYTRRKKSKKNRRGRILDTSSLPRFCLHHDIKEQERNCCQCQGPLHLIGQEKAEQLELLPQRFYIAEHIRYKYGCRHCETMTMAPKEPAPIPKSMAGASVLTEVILNKYHAHLPLYRQSKMIENLGLLIPDNTLGVGHAGR